MIFGNILLSIVKSGSKTAWSCISKLATRIIKSLKPQVTNSVRWVNRKFIAHKGGEKSLEKLLFKIWDDLAKGVKGLFKNSKHVLDLTKISIMAFFGYKVNQGVTYMKNHSTLDTLKNGSKEAWDFALNNTTLLLLLLIFIPQFRELLFYTIGKVFTGLTYILKRIPGFIVTGKEFLQKVFQEYKVNHKSESGGD